MKKEEVKKRIRYVLVDGFTDPNVELSKTASDIDFLIDAIGPEEDKVMLEKPVGDQWDKLVASLHGDQEGTAIDYALIQIVTDPSLRPEYGDLYTWWSNNRDSSATLIKAAKYGWIQKPAKKYLVYVPLTEQVFIYRRVADSYGKTRLEVAEYDEESEDPAELFTDEQIKELKLGEYEREEVPE